MSDTTTNINAIMKAFKIKIRYYMITDGNDNFIKMVTCGGTEVLKTAKNDAECNKLFEEFGTPVQNTQFADGQKLPFKYTDTIFSIGKLKELAKYKSIKSLSKEDALKINKDIKNKGDLEDKLVYITDDNPSTNSLALAKQFNLEHRNVILKLFELGSMYPSILMKIKYDVYSSVGKHGGRSKKEPNSETVVTDRSAEYSADQTQTTYDIFYHVPEDVYYQFVKKISTPKGLSTDAGMIKLIHIEEKQDEYFNAFTTLRKSLNELDIKRDEIDALIKIRTRGTSELRATIYDYVVKNNLNPNNKQLDIVNTNKFIFNIINYINNINAINYVPPTEEEVKQNKTRKTKEEHLQEELYVIEKAVNVTLLTSAKFGNPLVESLLIGLDKTEDEVKTILKEYKVSHLWDIMN